MLDTEKRNSVTGVPKGEFYTYAQNRLNCSSTEAIVLLGFSRSYLFWPVCWYVVSLFPTRSLFPTKLQRRAGGDIQ